MREKGACSRTHKCRSRAAHTIPRTVTAIRNRNFRRPKERSGLPPRGVGAAGGVHGEAPFSGGARAAPVGVTTVRRRRELETYEAVPYAPFSSSTPSSAPSSSTGAAFNKDSNNSTLAFSSSVASYINLI